MGSPPELTRVEAGGIAYWTDTNLAESGVRVCFTERSGGVSAGEYASLNLAHHVGDDARAVDRNRRLLARALCVGDAERLVTAEQVHGSRVAVVDAGVSGSGALHGSPMPPVSATDALVTAAPGIPLLLMFADCVPVILVAGCRGVGVAHAGWRGALAGIPGLAAATTAREAGCATSRVTAYVGPHIGACHYPVSDEIMSQFVRVFGTVARADSGGLDLGAVVSASLIQAGVDPCNIVRLGVCTAEATDRFFSHRAEHGRTGRHGALACILSPS